VRVAETGLRLAALVATLRPKSVSLSGDRDIAMQLDTSKGHPDMNYAEHVGTYKGFIKLAQIAVVLLVLLMVGMFVFLVPHA
jgi:hypothetical protein